MGVYTFCDPSGYQGTSDPAESLEENKKLYETANSGVLKPDGVAGSSYFQRVFGDGTGGNGVPNEATDITVEQAKQMSRVWDPVMAAQPPVGTMCPMHGSGNGYSTSTVGNVNQVNPKETLLLEGQAFYVSLAPSQYSLPLTSTTDETQTANEAKQK